MKMKFFQPLADIERHYETVLRAFKQGENGLSLLETWNIFLEDKLEIEEEYEAIRYLVSCQTMMAHGKDVSKPTVVVANRLFNRHLSFLSSIFGCDASNYRKESSPLIRKEYQACRHYLFQFSLPAWYEKLPTAVLTFENKYAHLSSEKPLEI